LQIVTLALQSLQFLTEQGKQAAGVEVALKKYPSLQVKQRVSANTPFNLHVAQFKGHYKHLNSSSVLTVYFGLVILQTSQDNPFPAELTLHLSQFSIRHCLQIF